MKFVSCLSFALLIPCVVAVGQDQSGQGDVVVLYDGGDLSGWEGRDDLWSVENGEIVGRTTKDNRIRSNTFLIWKGGTPDNYELTAQFKIEGGNSGIQYRSKVFDAEKFVVGGYQADIDFGNRYAGILYEEKGRGILAERGQKVVIGSDGKKEAESFADSKELGNKIKPGEWNDFRVVADGNHLQHFINGQMTMDLVDEQSDKAAKSGVIALQLHTGPPMVVRFKNIKIRNIK